MVLNGYNYKEVLKQFDDIDYAKENVEKHYSSQSWYLNLKRNSQVMGIILQQKDLFDSIGVSIDKVIITLCSMYNYSKTNTYTKLPDKYLTIRNQLSKDLTTQIFYLLSKTDLVDIKYESRYMLVKLNKNILTFDDYFLTKANKFSYNDEIVLLKCQTEKESVFFYPYTNRTFFLHLKEAIMGITLAYNELREQQEINSILESNGEVYKKREDIKYLEIPINIISKVLRLPKNKILSYIYKLYTTTNYISKHDKVYVDTKGIEHFYNCWYRVCEVKDYRGVVLEKEHPKVTIYSAILHTSSFNRSKVGKYVNKHMNDYRNIVQREIQFMEVDRDYIDTEELEDVCEFVLPQDTVIQRKLTDYFESDSIINKSKTRKTKTGKENPIKIKIKNIENYSFRTVCRVIKQLLDYIPNCAMDSIGYWVGVYDKLYKRYQTYITEYKEKNIYNSYKHYVEYYQLQSI